MNARVRWIVGALTILTACRDRVPAELPVKPDEAPVPSQASELWGDGYAELNGYELQYPHRGGVHEGTAVLVFVMETFSKSHRVKADRGRHPDSDLIPIIKLNVVKDVPQFDLHIMTSVFAAWPPRGGLRAGWPMKLDFSAHDRSGGRFEELLFDADGIQRSRTLTAGDVRAQQLAMHAGGFVVDELMFLARRIPDASLGPGERRSVRVLSSMERGVLAQPELQWGDGIIERVARTSTLTVPAGRFEVETWRAEVDGAHHEVQVDVRWPHHVISWHGPGGEIARLRGTKRMKYWQLNRNRDEALLDHLGLSPVAR